MNDQQLSILFEREKAALIAFYDEERRERWLAHMREDREARCQS